MSTIIVSNRLPISIDRQGASLRVTRSAGGLATALSSNCLVSSSLWIGWPGLSDLNPDEWERVQSCCSEIGAIPVDLTADEIEGYYDGFSNGAIWPLFHYLPGQLPLHVEGWAQYVRVNRKFADTVAANYAPGDEIWVHDYHLMLLPALLRERLPHARIGFFLHIPFPGSETFSVLPHREEILDGLLGADLVGFHTTRYTQHFETALKRLRGLDTRCGIVAHGGRQFRIGVFPVSVNAAQFETRAQADGVATEARQLRANGGKLLLGVDRLDYTKGIPRRLLAFSQLLEHKPEWRERVRLIQVAVPSRDSVGAYRRFRQEVNTFVGSINGRFGTPHWTPVQYIHRSVSNMQLLALYRATDVMLVTPIRDGMNLVAKEFVATRSDEDGVLILSEFAGAAAELTDALIVNPFDIEATARQIDTALRISAPERRNRMRKLRQVVFDYDVDRWTREFIAALRDGSGSR